MHGGEERVDTTAASFVMSLFSTITTKLALGVVVYTCSSAVYTRGARHLKVLHRTYPVACQLQLQQQSVAILSAFRLSPLSSYVPSVVPRPEGQQAKSPPHRLPIPLPDPP